MKSNIIPAIMPQKFFAIEDSVNLVRHAVGMVQLDLMDGKYVPEKTWPFHYKNDHDLRDLIAQDISLPLWEEIDYELDLMVERPEEQLDTWLQIGAARVIFHYASIHDWDKIRDIGPGVRNFIKIGLAVTIHDDLEKACLLVEEGLFDYIQVMGISRIGYMGEPFATDSLAIIRDLKKKYPHMMITVDGGVSLDTIADLANVGATEFVSGSGVFGGGEVEENIYNLEDESGLFSDQD